MLRFWTTKEGHLRSHTIIDSPIGALTLVATDGALSGVYMQEHRHMPDASTFGDRDDRGFGEPVEQLQQYFAAERTQFTLHTQAAGSDFQRRVWAALATIPYGQTWSYAELTDVLGKRSAIRAVAAANGKNPLSIVVPCHRVVGSDGSLTGFAGGLARKRFLLDLEAPVGTRTGQLF